MHLWRVPFSQDNGIGTTVANWLTQILRNEAPHVGK